MYEPVIKETINTNVKAVTGLQDSQGTPDTFVKAIALDWMYQRQSIANESTKSHKISITGKQTK